MKWGKRAVAALLIAACVMSGGCGAADTAADAAAGRENVVQEAVCPVEEGKKLVVYTSHKEEVYGPIIREFEERTGIWVQVRAGGTTELLEEIRREGGAGSCDVMFGGGVESYEAYKDCFQSYECGQQAALDKTFCSEDHRWTVFSSLPIVFIYNHKLVSREDAPKRWADFLSGRWDGKIAFADPGKSGTSCTVLSALVQQMKPQPEEQVLGMFAGALGGAVSGGSGQVLDEVQAGTRLVGITLEEAAKKRMAQGENIAMVYPEDGTSVVPDGSGLVKGAPHAENGKLFIDFTVSSDTQEFLTSQMYRRSVRNDVGAMEDESGLRVMDFDLEWASAHQKELLETWNRLMGQSAER